MSTAFPTRRFAAYKKNEIKPWRKIGWVIPPEANAEFVAAMERVLDVYRRPYNVDIPVICMDETPRQLIRETRTPFRLASANSNGTTTNTSDAVFATSSWRASRWLERG